ncbi:MAG: S8 family serine peptidase [Acidimicrobiia bacterium]|nr:S8 family serine peptidase [Acidimicrobiia bacterium]
MNGKPMALLVAVVWAVLLPVVPAGAHHPEPAYVPDQVVVKLAPGSGASIDQINTTWATSTVETVFASRGIYLLSTPQGVDPEGLAEEMEDDPRLAYAEPNFHSNGAEFQSHSIYAWGDLLTARSSTDPTLFAGQYAVDMLGLSGGLPTGDGVVAAVLDTGVQATHPLLAGRLTAARYDFIDDDPDPDDAGNGRDDNGDGLIDEAVGHGTHIASLIGLVAPDAQVMPLRVLNSDGEGNVFVIAEAIEFALENGAHVLSLSLGSTNESELLEEVLEEIAEDDLVVVAAAGNLDSTQPFYPAATEDVLGVTAIGPGYVRSPFSNHGSWVDLAVPGEDIYGAYPNDQYAWWGGTSMSVPLVAGQAAVLLGVDSDLEPEDVSYLITSTALSVDPYNPDHVGLLGRGVPDIAGSVTALATVDLDELG